jgi:ribosomal protein S12 methylthiotransferase
VLANSQRIIPYIDIPLQHASDPMLRRMARRVTRPDTEALLRKLRSRIPNLTLRTTFITGFPGETDEDFEELVAFAKEWRFERMGVFTYSLEPDTPAANLPNHLPEELKEARLARLMEVQQEHAFAWNESQLGKVIPVILDQPVEGEKNVWIGRSQADAPDVDGLVFVTGGKVKLKAGDIVPVEIVAMQEYDLVGVAADKPIKRQQPGRILSLASK